MLNIMLAFLSTVRVNNGAQPWQPDYCAYPEIEADGMGKTHTTNESALRKLLLDLKQAGERLDYYICLTTKTVEENAILAKIDAMTPKWAEQTHLSYFKERLQSILDKAFPGEGRQAADMVKSVPYSETEDAVTNVSTRPVMNVLRKVKELQETHSHQDNRIQIYMDITGGMRDANMMLLIISRLLTYNPDITVKQVLYSNLDNKLRVGTIQSVTKAFNLLDLIAGISEFTNFGSTRSLEHYFKLDTMPQNALLYPLLQAMKDFSQKIRLCRYGELLDSIENLQHELTDFQEASVDRLGQDVDAYIFAAYLPGIRDKYLPLFHAEGRYFALQDLKLIRWCVENDCIQQAMTLITERIPEVLFNMDSPILKIAEGDPAGLQAKYIQYKEKIEKKGTEVAVTQNFWLTALDSVGTQLRGKDLKGKFINRIFTALQDIVNNQVTVIDAVMKPLETLKKEAEMRSQVDLTECQRQLEKLLILIQKKSVTKEEIDEICKERGVIAEIFKLAVINNLRTQGTCADLKKIVNRLTQCQLKDKNGSTIDKKYFIKTPLAEVLLPDIRDYPGNYGDVYQRLLNKDIIAPHGVDKTLKYVLLYYELKTERNSVNHAHNKKEQTTLPQLITKMTTLVDGLEQMMGEGA